MSPNPTDAPDARREALALALAGGSTVRRAAKRAKVSESTAFLWKADPEFRARVTELRGQLFTEAVGVLAGLNGRAARRLGKLLDSATEKVALAAACKVLELGSRLREAGELAERLAEVEKRLGRLKR